MPEESIFGAGVIKSINCLEKEMEGELVPSAAVTLVFVTGFRAVYTALKHPGGWGCVSAEEVKLEEV